MSRPLAITVWTATIVLIAIILAFAGIRVAVDVPLIVSGEVPDPDAFEVEYVKHPVLAYSHIGPGVVYLIGAPFQLSRRFRSRHRTLHHRMGRVVLAAGAVSGVFALAFGIPFATGGRWQAVATALFGTYFVVALGLAYRAIRRGDVTRHRRWMIRAFAMGIAVGTIRIWVGLLSGLGPLRLAESFATAFWAAFTMHAVAAEVWLLLRPSASGRPWLGRCR